MITLYYRRHSKSSKYAIDWFKQHNLSVSIINIKKISEKEIFQLVYLSNMDIQDILRKNTLLFFLNLQKNKANKLRFSESLAYLKKKSYLLQDPIIISSDISLLGYEEKKLEKYFNNF